MSDMPVSETALVTSSYAGGGEGALSWRVGGSSESRGKNFVKSWNFTWNHILLVPGGKGADATNLAMSLCSSKRFFLNWNTTNQLNMWMAPKTPMSPMADTNSLWFIEVLRWPKNNINAIRTWNDSSSDQVFFLFDEIFCKKKNKKISGNKLTNVPLKWAESKKWNTIF